MATIPSYLQGTRTAGLLDSTQGSLTPPGTKSFIPGQGLPSIPGVGSVGAGALTGAGVIPGVGSVGAGAMAGAANSSNIFNDSNYSGLSEYERNKLASIASGHDFFMTDQFLNTIKDRYNGPVNAVGKDEAWLSPDELRAKLNNLDTGMGSGGVSGGFSTGGSAGAGAGGGGGGGAGYGGLLSGGVTGQVGNGSPSGIQPFPNIPGSIGGGNGQVPGSGSGQVGGGQIPGNQVSGGQQLPMMQMGAGNALQQYYNTPGYQLTNGQGAVNQFQQSPGYQFAVDQALSQVQRQGASRGLLDSGAGLRAMTDRAQGMANQEFNNWQQNQQNQYQNYQNRLQGLAGTPTGADMAYGLGQGVAGNNMATGSNIGSILANQGNSLFGGIVGAGGAQAQNVTQAGNMQAQILAGNLQTQMMLAALAAGQQKS